MNVQECFLVNSNGCYLNCIDQSWSDPNEMNTIWAGFSISCFSLGLIVLPAIVHKLSIIIEKGQLITKRIFKQNDSMDNPESIESNKKDELNKVKVNRFQQCFQQENILKYAIPLACTGTATSLTGWFHIVLSKQTINESCLNLCNSFL